MNSSCECTKLTLTSVRNDIRLTTSNQSNIFCEQINSTHTRPIVIKMSHFVRKSLHLIGCQGVCRRLVDNIVISGRDGAISYVLRIQEEIVSEERNFFSLKTGKFHWIEPYLSGSVTTSSTTVPGLGLTAPLKNLVLIRFDTMTKWNFNCPLPLLS